jgi:hypothetical protein
VKTAAEVMMTADDRIAKIEAHEANLKRYARLLATQLTDTERAFIHRRIAEERLALERLYSPLDGNDAPHIASNTRGYERAP